ncbi:MAG: amino acid ABC transporter permease [Mesorhizobium sp.]|uniref:amino acid ABC transporter permease n=1 Tax=unclassified Mesorhizobium TaxID=325217 RepID=UPI000FC9F150|nr:MULTISPECIES: amino acid ABC transporter permease [unclassified Mesorhizobium]RUV72980.1 amino acid ABC transporter permease [Mesorhizobium sp. M5C.F.Cr.IN.023.01.1.1]RWF85487.1 MAG: amino acid ABC transporter permease [Mesorhizobium sp.]RWF93242.1 MAG: amino acid ABC transporter permease [Mesorhizobium sp.]RWH42039.1 MAG: amino acid ABC transporter permease [Mesorhizobium sp.]RWI40614.1 MAG: amino acid ABC transporter permease [Mesorhizobium sp.]
MSLLETFFNADVMISSLPALLRGFLNTLLLGLLSIGIGIPVGLVISLIRLYAPKPLRLLAVGYIDIFRAMPVLVVLILIYYALPFLGIRLSSWTFAVTAFAIIMAAYSAEVFRSGIESIPRGQFEAAQALGLPFLLTLRKVVLPQAIRVVIPPMTSNCVSMFKDTSLASTVALPELLKEATNAQSLYANPSPLIGAALVYLLFLWPMVRLVSLLERRFKTEKTR